MRKLLKMAGALLLIVFLVVAAYVGYVFVSYSRIEDNLVLEVSDAAGNAMLAGEEYTAVTWNVGFGAYSSEYSFFMDGGTESRAYSKDAVLQNTGAAIDRLKELDADLMLLQEVDMDSTRSYHVDQSAMFRDAFAGMDAVFAQNYDSAYLCYPVFEPHGASKSGVFTLAKSDIVSAVRTSLPIERGFMKIFDLDRCYSVSRIPVSDGKELCLYNLHLSAYTSDGSIVTEQLKLLLADMQTEYQAGNYVIAGGDFNMDLPGNSPDIFDVTDWEYNWAQPIPYDLLPEELSVADSWNVENPVPSCRNADKPYTPGESFVVTVDGFIVSDNIELLDCCVEDEAFAVSDHNPVTLRFRLGEQA